MMYMKDIKKFKSYCQAWRKQVPNDKLIIAATWDSDGGDVDKIAEKIKYCEEEGFNWCVTGNRYKYEQLEAIRKAVNI